MPFLAKVLAPVSLVALLAAPLAAQAGPCEEAIDRYIDCIKDAEQKKEVKAHRKEMLDACNASKQGKAKAQSCLKKAKCKPFLTCMDKK